MKEIEVDSFEVKVPPDDFTTIQFTIVDGNSYDVFDNTKGDIKDHEILLVGEKSYLYVDEFRCSNIHMKDGKMIFDGFMHKEDKPIPLVPIWTTDRDNLVKELI